jgi:hypothetical protein
LPRPAFGWSSRPFTFPVSKRFLMRLRGCEPFLFAVSNGRFKCLRRLDFFAGALPGLAITAHRPRDLF